MPSILSGLFRPARQVIGGLTGEACTIAGLPGTFLVTFGEEAPAVDLDAHGTNESVEVTARFSRTEFTDAPPFGATLIREGGIRYKIGASGSGPNSWTTTLRRLDRSAPPDNNPFPV